jgi:surface antigen
LTYIPSVRYPKICNRGKSIRRIELSPVLKRARQEAERLRKIAMKRFKRERSKLNKTFSKKKNQRRLAYVILSFTILGLATGLFGAQVLAHQKAAELQRVQQRVQQTESKVQKAEETKNQAVQTLEQVKVEKTNTDTILQQKAADEARMKAELDAKNAENEKLKQDLQAKKDEESKIAAAQSQDQVAIAQTSGRGGSGEAPSSRRYVPGNGYDQGYCTWYVKNRRPDIGNYWGNANQWLYSAQAEGYATGGAPRAGAIGVSSEGYYGHVVYVESVNSDGSVNISEMNYQGWNIQDSRTTSASEFVYIY